MTRNRYCLIILLILVCLSACGRKTLPVPPYAVIPQQIKDLRFFQDESKVVLNWTYPAKTTIKTDLKDIESFQIYRAVIPEEEYCETCPTPFSSFVEVDFKEAVTDLKNRQASYTEILLRPDHRYIYKVKTKAGWRLISADSNLVSFSWDSPAAAPTEILVEPGDQSIVLKWEEVTHLADGSAVSGPLFYQVYRKTGNKDFSPVGTVATNNEFRDVGIVNGRNYEYRIKALQQKENNKIYGISSRVVSAVARDLTPPMPPRGLRTVTVTGGVKLLWEESHETDIGGYKIYRRSGLGEERQLLGETKSSETVFLDKLSEGKQTYIYSVTAFDRAQPANESLFSKEKRYEPF